MSGQNGSRPIKSPVRSQFRTEGQPLLTLDAVRVALRKLDASHEATVWKSGTSIQTGITSGPNRARGRGARRGGRGRGGATGSRRKKSSCFVCKDPNHRVWDNDSCRIKWEITMNSIGDAAAGSAKDTPTGPSSDKSPEKSLSGVSFYQPPPSDSSRNGLETLVTVQSSLSVHDDRTGDAIIDGGATGTVIGAASYYRLCDALNLKPNIDDLQSTDPQWHAFGMSDNSSHKESIIGSTVIPIPCGKGNLTSVRTMIVDGQVPFVIGKPTLRQLDALEAHNQDYLEISLGAKGRFRLATYMHEDGHAHLPLRREDMDENMAQCMISTSLSHTDRRNMTLEEKRRLLQHVHIKTHLHPTSLRLLMKRNNLWESALESTVKQIFEHCSVCIRTGDPEPSRKISFGKMHAQFNQRVYLDILYWADAEQRMVLNCVDYATSFAKLNNIEDRRVVGILRLFERTWLNCHGSPELVICDQEFDKDVVRKWMADRDISFIALPARTHNKAAIVERKNRVVKDILERLEVDRITARLPFEDKLSKAEFLSNVMYGNQVSSAFEMAKGYTPSLQGTAQVPLPEEIRNSQEELTARRLLTRIMRSRPASKHGEVRKGQVVLALVPGGPRRRGHWIKTTVEEVKTDGSIKVGKGTKVRAVAREHVRTLPLHDLAKVVVQAEAGIMGEDDAEVKRDDAEVGSTSSSSSSSESESVAVDEADDVQARSKHGEMKELDPLLYTPPAADAPEEGEKSLQAEIRDPTSTEGNRVSNEPPPHSTRRRSARARKQPKRYTPTTHTDLSNPVDRDEIIQGCLRQVYSRIGGNQFMKHEVVDIPDWMYDEAHAAEVNKNWVKNKVDVRWEEIPEGANIIGSHIVYNVKETEERPQSTVPKLKLKARICAHGNQDDERESLRTDAAVASHVCFRLIYSLAMIFSLILGKLDIRGAYTQSGPAHRNVYVRPPRCLGLRNVFWLLTMTIYGLVSAGRKWQRASDLVMMRNLGLQHVLGLPQLFYHPATEIATVVAKYVDDILIAARNQEWLDWTFGGIREAFDISSAAIAPGVLRVNSTDIYQCREYVQLDMKRYHKAELELFSISPPRRKQVGERLSQVEIRSVRRVAGKIGYLGTCVSPFAAFASSYLQQCLPRMTVAGLKMANGIIREVMRYEPTIMYLRPSEEEKSRARIVAFSDAGFPHSGDMSKVAQEGCIVGISFGKTEGSIFHTVLFVSRKQRRRSQSSGAAETIASIMTLGYAQQIQQVYAQIASSKLPITLVVDSKGLHECLATEHTARDPSMAGDVHLLREYYAAKIIDELAWVPGKKNPADPLTKPHAGTTADLLHRMLVEGRLTVGVNNQRSYGSALQEEL